jgi:hypothetical protein
MWFFILEKLLSGFFNWNERGVSCCDFFLAKLLTFGFKT